MNQHRIQPEDVFTALQRHILVDKSGLSQSSGTEVLTLRACLPTLSELSFAIGLRAGAHP